MSPHRSLPTVTLGAAFGRCLAIFLATAVAPLWGCAKDATPLSPPNLEGQPAARPPQLEPATSAGPGGALVYRGVLAGATAADKPPPDTGQGMPYPGPDEDILLASALTPFIQFKVPGYFQSCFDQVTVEVRSGSGWSVVAQAPAHGQYVLDGKEVGYTMCDVVSCLPIEHELRVPLVQLVPARAAPPNEQGWPSLESQPLRGEVRVRFPHFSNSGCTSRDVAEQRVIL